MYTFWCENRPRTKWKSRKCLGLCIHHSIQTGLFPAVTSLSLRNWALVLVNSQTQNTHAFTKLSQGADHTHTRTFICAQQQNYTQIPTDLHTQIYCIKASFVPPLQPYMNAAFPRSKMLQPSVWFSLLFLHSTDRLHLLRSETILPHSVSIELYVYICCVLS